MSPRGVADGQNVYNHLLVYTLMERRSRLGSDS